LAVQVDDSGIEIATNTLQLKNLGVSTAKLQDNCVQTAKIQDANVTGVKLAAAVAGNGLSQNVSGNLDINAGDGLDFNGDNLEVQLGQGLGFAPDGVIEPEVDDATIEIDGVSNEIQVKDLGITSGKLADGSVQTAKIGDDQVTFAKVGWRMHQELSTISGSSTTTIDLARALDANAVNGVLVFKNGLAMLNQTALSGTAANSDEFSVSADGGAGSVGRLTFVAALADADSILIWYLT